MHYRNRLSVILILSIAFLFLSCVVEAQNQEEFSKVLPLNAQGTFSLKNVNGDVTVMTWKEEKVEIKAVKKTRKASENLAKVKIEVAESPNSVSVNTVYPKRNNTGVSVTYDIKVPEGVHLEAVSTVNGDIVASGPFGRVSGSTVNGKVSVENSAGDLHLSTTNGSVEAQNVKGKIDAETTNGSVRLELDGLTGDIKAETTNGGITLALSGITELNAVLEAETVNGGIDVDFPVSFQSLQKSKHSLKGQIGQGGPRISLETVNGSIHLTK
jgi:DUF4097 and DUF4098 domain-containing protein YvlB